MKHLILGSFFCCVCYVNLCSCSLDITSLLCNQTKFISSLFVVLFGTIFKSPVKNEKAEILLDLINKF